MAQAPDNTVVPTGLTIIDIDANTVNRANQISHIQRFSDVYHSTSINQQVIQAGDVLNIALYEAPPAMLLGTSGSLTGGTSSAEIKLPDQMVDSRGQISIPFLGKLTVAGKNPQQVQDMIVNGLKRKANQPSAIVSIGKNNSANVTVVGEVSNSVRMPLTGKGERVLDAIAAAGGTKYPSSRVTVQVNRGMQSVEMPMESLLNDARQNVVLQPGDVVSVNYQSKSFTVLGATVKNDEVNFESNGISLMQALARSGGLNDNRADARGVFIFRYETPRMLTYDQLAQVPPAIRQTGRIPVVYRLNLKDPMNYIVAQNFPIHNNDVVYVSNAPATEFAKFLGMISQTVFSITGIKNLS
ncbi:polysaccharide biosynthesis/export family protein [Faucicola atlantae]|uniref:polysaccharide biosynthesis/export family protein n=1 Tax=Faucicola atlantae TaxID=34059 RepID=UPI0025B11405|nr:polysaccharide biosynthesis/export family protein [Moraxella atlantae]